VLWRRRLNHDACKQAAFLAIRVCVRGVVWCERFFAFARSEPLCCLACLVKISMSDVSLLSCVCVYAC